MSPVLPASLAVLGLISSPLALGALILLHANRSHAAAARAAAEPDLNG